MDEVRVTRGELLIQRNRIRFTEQGSELLKRKRDALLMEFRDSMEQTLALSDSLQAAVREAGYSLAVAQAVDGVVALRSAAMATKGQTLVEVSETRVIGVLVPVVTNAASPVRSPFTRAYSATGVSSRVDEVAEKFEHVLEIVILDADAEIRLRRIAEELNKTNRRIRKLEQVTIPALHAQVSRIEEALEERVREDFYRLKKAKQQSLL